MADPAANAAVATNPEQAVHGTAMAPRDIAGGNGLKGTESGTGAVGGPEHVADPVDNLIGFTSTGWVGIVALVVLIGMVVWKVPAKIGASLDKKIADIRAQLDEAARLRAEAEALKAEYQAKAASAHQDAETIRAHAHTEANAIITKARTDAEELMERRARMAEDKIAAAERAAIAELRARAAEAATQAAAALIAGNHDAAADKPLVDRTISGLGRFN